MIQSSNVEEILRNSSLAVPIEKKEEEDEVLRHFVHFEQCAITVSHHRFVHFPTSTNYDFDNRMVMVARVSSNMESFVHFYYAYLANAPPHGKSCMNARR